MDHTSCILQSMCGSLSHWRALDLLLCICLKIGFCKMSAVSNLTVVLIFQVDNVNSFEWVKQLRYYWDPDLDNCVVRMSNSLYIYGYEYLGASARLVITPLTVSIFVCKIRFSEVHKRIFRGAIEVYYVYKQVCDIWVNSAYWLTDRPLAPLKTYPTINPSNVRPTRQLTDFIGSF